MDRGLTFRYGYDNSIRMASVNTQFSIAVHVLAGLEKYGPVVTSEGLAGSVNANPAFVKRVLAKLSKAKLVRNTVGKSGGCSLARRPKDISLLDVYNAVGAPRAFAIHDYPSVKTCLVSSNIKRVMGTVLESAQRSLEVDLKKTTIEDVVVKLAKK
jgi:Rrf2 family protein